MCWPRRFGLSAVFQHVPELFAAVKLAGALYLVWLGIGMLRSRGLAADLPRREGKERAACARWRALSSSS